MKRALALAAMLMLAGCESELNHALNYDHVRRDPAAQVSPPAAVAETPRATAPPAVIVTPPGAIAPPVAITASPPAPMPVQAPAQPPADSPGTAFCKSSAAGEANAGAFDEATRRNVYGRSLAQCLALHGN